MVLPFENYNYHDACKFYIDNLHILGSIYRPNLKSIIYTCSFCL